MDFKKLVEEVKDKYDYVAVCRGRFGREPVFYIVFENHIDLKDFLDNTDDGNGTEFTDNHFYAQGFKNGEFYGENT